MVKHVRAQEYDAHIGMDAFSTQAPGIGGRLRQNPEDFVVQEIGLDGSIAPLEPTGKEYEDQPGKYTAFFLVKRNIDTIQAIRRLSRTLGVSYKRFSYAGIKDRRAITSQRASLYRASPHHLIGRDLRNIKILHPHRVPKPILPGGLWGNRFTTVVREVERAPDEMLKQIETVRQQYEERGGVLNFFGPQRFGIIYPNTHLIGQQILHGNLKAAINLLLHQSTEEDTKPLVTPNSNSIEQPTYQTYERAVSQYLKKHPQDYKGSIRVLPKDLTRLYIHAYQSFLFNRMISERVRLQIPLNQPTIGDFVMPVAGEVHGVRMVTRVNLSQARKSVKTKKHVIMVPIIGYDFENVKFEGSMGEIINSILSKEKISPSQFRLKELPMLSSRGTFRPLLIQPTNFSFEQLEDDTAAVKIHFDLLKGSYASVILREYIKPQFPTQL